MTTSIITNTTNTINLNTARNTLSNNQITKTVTHYINKPLKIHKDLFNIFHLNIRSLKNKFNDIKHELFKDSKAIYHVIILSETWLKKEETQFFEIDGYTMYNSVRSRIGGGITMYVKNTIQSNQHFEYNDNNNNFLFVNLNQIHIKICSVYKTKNNTFFPILDEILMNNTNCIIF